MLLLRWFGESSKNVIFLICFQTLRVRVHRCRQEQSQPYSNGQKLWAELGLQCLCGGWGPGDPAVIALHPALSPLCWCPLTNHRCLQSTPLSSRRALIAFSSKGSNLLLKLCLMGPGLWVVLWSPKLNPKLNSDHLQLILHMLCLDSFWMSPPHMPASYLLPYFLQMIHLQFYTTLFFIYLPQSLQILHRTCIHTQLDTYGHDLSCRAILPLNCRDGETLKDQARVLFGGRKEDNIYEPSHFCFYPFIVVCVVTFRIAEINCNTLKEYY